MRPEVQLGLDLWQVYADNGRILPATWVARAVRVSPTTMLRHLADRYRARKGRTPERGWNWSRLAPQVMLALMEKYISNGHEFETEEVPEGEDYGNAVTSQKDGQLSVEESGWLLDYTTAVLIAADGMAIARAACCERVIFRKDDVAALFVGTMNADGICTGDQHFEPSSEDATAKDWMICAVAT